MIRNFCKKWEIELARLLRIVRLRIHSGNYAVIIPCDWWFYPQYIENSIVRGVSIAEPNVFAVLFFLTFLSQLIVASANDTLDIRYKDFKICNAASGTPFGLMTEHPQRIKTS